MRAALAAGNAANELTVADLERAAVEVTGGGVGVAEADLTRALDPVTSVTTHQMFGGPEDRPMAVIRRRQQERLAAQRQAVVEVSDRARTAWERLWRLSREAATT